MSVLDVHVGASRRMYRRLIMLKQLHADHYGFFDRQSPRGKAIIPPYSCLAVLDAQVSAWHYGSDATAPNDSSEIYRISEDGDYREALITRWFNNMQLEVLLFPNGLTNSIAFIMVTTTSQPKPPRLPWVDTPLIESAALSKAAGW